MNIRLLIIMSMFCIGQNLSAMDRSIVKEWQPGSTKPRKTCVRCYEEERGYSDESSDEEDAVLASISPALTEPSDTNDTDESRQKSIRDGNSWPVDDDSESSTGPSLVQQTASFCNHIWNSVTRGNSQE